MKTYQIDFIAKQGNAIGVFQVFTDNRIAANPSEAVLSLYDKYSHIHMPIITDIETKISYDYRGFVSIPDFSAFDKFIRMHNGSTSSEFEKIK